MVSLVSRRRAVKYLVEEGLSTAPQACRALGLTRSSYYLVSRKRPSTLRLNQKIVDLSEQHPRYGYRRITALMRRNGRKVNLKRVQRVRREAGLQVRKKQKRRRRVGPTASVCGLKSGTRFGVGTSFSIKPNRAERCGFLP
jgi:hypothetical protein